MKGQAQGFLDHARQQHLECTMVMRDMGSTFSAPFEQLLNVQQIRVVKVGPKAPNLNAFIERWIRRIKDETLDHFTVFGQAHFDYVDST